MLLKIFLVSIAVLSVGAKPEGRIVGGQAARGGQFPYAAAIYVTKAQGTYFCGGTLINNQWIVTAGQCAYGAVTFQIQLGSTTLSGTDSNRVVLATATSEIYPLYDDETLVHDIALIKLRLPIAFNQYIAPLNLPTSFTPDYTTLIAMGWGQVDDFNTGLSNDLTYVSVTSISNDECQLTYGPQISHNMVCVAGNFNEGICNGDMGGGVVTSGTNAVLVAVASFRSQSGCESTDPSGYTRIVPYVEWIRNVIDTY